MATFLAQFQSIKCNCDHLILEVEDVSDLWPVVKGGFEERLPFRRAYLNNKTRNLVLVEELHAEFILTTDARLRSRFRQEQSLFWFREPYATIILVTCEDLDEFKTILKPRLRMIVQKDDREWFIIFVSKAHPNNDNATKMAKRVYARLAVDFSAKKRERCCKLDLHGADANDWDDLESKIMECIRNTLDRRVQFYEEELRKLTEQRFLPVWSFCNFFVLKESLAFMFEIAHLFEDSLREYDELELCYLETVTAGRRRDFGGIEHGDDQAALLNPVNKPLIHIIQDDTFREFEFRQYLFACQSKHLLPFCFREIWEISACLALLSATASPYEDGPLVLDLEKEFYRLNGDLYSLCRNKFIRLGFLVGYGMHIERSPANSASLSTLSWPKPAVWPSVPSDASSEVLLVEKMVLCEIPKTKHFGIQRKQLPLEPSFLLREANRRRVSLSVADTLEIVNRPGYDIYRKAPSSPTEHGGALHKNIPCVSEKTVDAPMTLAEIYVASKHALKRTISDSNLWRSLSTLEEYEEKYLELTKGAANNYHRSWWKRHGVVLDGEIAAVWLKRGNIELAAKLYEKVCALLAGEGWQDLLADVLPNLAECQKRLNDQARYLSSCVRLLSLDKSLFSAEEFGAFQEEVVRLAHGKMEHAMPLDVSSLLMFSGDPSPPVELSDGDPGIVLVTVWSGFPSDITLESFSLSLTATDNTDDGDQVLKCVMPTVLRPGKNPLTLNVPPQKPGSYVLGVLTGQIGQLRFRTHSFGRGGPTDTDDLMGYEKPNKPILKVSKPRVLVEVNCVVSSALLMNEAQWVGIIVRPIGYSLKGAVLQIDTGPGLRIEEPHFLEIGKHNGIDGLGGTCEEGKDCTEEDLQHLNVDDGRVMLPDWVSNIASVIWIPVRATSEETEKETCTHDSVVDRMRTIALRLDFGVSHTQKFERTLAVHFTEPFHVSSFVADRCSGGTRVLQAMLQSQLTVTLTIHDAWIDLEEGFMEHGSGTVKSIFPIELTPASRAGIFFTVRHGGESKRGNTLLHVKYSVHGRRDQGAHPPSGITGMIVFSAALILKRRPVPHPFLSIGFLPLPSERLKVGHHLTIRWRVERLREERTTGSESGMLFEVNASCENWMLIGRKRGYVLLPASRGSRMEISITCIPLVAGYIRPPQLVLPDVDGATLTTSGHATPHLLCVLPPATSSSFIVPASSPSTSSTEEQSNPFLFQSNDPV